MATLSGRPSRPVDEVLDVDHCGLFGADDTDEADALVHLADGLHLEALIAGVRRAALILLEAVDLAVGRSEMPVELPVELLGFVALGGGGLVGSELDVLRRGEGVVVASLTGVDGVGDREHEIETARNELLFVDAREVARIEGLGRRRRHGERLK